MDGEEVDHSINDLTGELCWKAFRDPRDGLCSGPSHNGILRRINLNSLSSPVSRTHPVLQSLK
jgi:hypothetical protein